jgi:uncharacterized membrane protein
MLTGLFLTLLALVGIIAIMVWIVQLPFVALLINIGLIALAAWIVQGPFVALLAIVGFIAVVLSALRWATTVDMRRHRTTTPDVRTALDVLNARYARGEIDQAEYREKRALLASGRRRIVKNRRFPPPWSVEEQGVSNKRRMWPPGQQQRQQPDRDSQAFTDLRLPKVHYHDLRQTTAAGLRDLGPPYFRSTQD